MTIKEKLTLVVKEFTTLANRVKTKFSEKNNLITLREQAITQVTQQKNEAVHKLELEARENGENEKVLEQLMKEFQELIKSL